MRLIDADALKKAIEQYQIQWNKNSETDIAHWDSCECILAIIDNASTVEFSKEICSVCGRYIREKDGADMRGKGHGD